MAYDLKDAPMIGKVAECGMTHRLGVINSILIDETKLSVVKYEGIGFDGKAWITSCPIVKAACIQDYINSVTNKTTNKMAQAYEDVKIKEDIQDE